MIVEDFENLLNVAINEKETQKICCILDSQGLTEREAEEIVDDWKLSIVKACAIMMVVKGDVDIEIDKNRKPMIVSKHICVQMQKAAKMIQDVYSSVFVDETGINKEIDN